MSTYVIGDIQGCLDDLKKLLTKIQFSSDKDKIWFTGDLVNRGPKSLETLRFVKEMGDNAIAVLGNHDLHMLAIAYGLQHQRPSDTLDSILTANDKDSLLEWVANLPLLHTANDDQHILVHAGIYPTWTISQAKQYAAEVEAVLKSDQRIEFFRNMYGNQPDTWDESLQDWERLRFITNVFTRMRYCTPDGKLDLKSSIAPSNLPSDQADELVPWYTLRNDKFNNKQTRQQLFFGHWSTLGLCNENNIRCLDTGCLWGGTLTALKIEDNFSIHQIDCKGEKTPF